MPGERATVLAVLGKGGAGKTVFSALVARCLLDMDRGPLLLVDADPVGGLAHAVGAGMEKTMGGVRDHLIREAGDPGTDRDALAESVDWLALEALQERGAYSLLAMGHTERRGCFCPLNSLLRAAVERLARGFRYVILDAEAGIEQVNRQVIRHVDIPVVITDGSMRGQAAARLTGEVLAGYGMAGAGLVLNRVGPVPAPEELVLWGQVPADDEVGEFDRQGRSLLELPAKSKALQAVAEMVRDRIP